MFLLALIGSVVVAGAALAFLGDGPFPDRLPGAAVIVAGFLAVMWGLTHLLGLAGASPVDTPAGSPPHFSFLRLPRA